MKSNRVLTAIALISVWASLSRCSLAQEQAKVDAIAVVKSNLERPASFLKDVLPILEDKCQGCHSSVLSEGKLMLEEHAQVTKGGKRGPAIVPGKASDSLLVKAAGRTAQPFMPPP